MAQRYKKILRYLEKYLYLCRYIVNRNNEYYDGIKTTCNIRVYGHRGSFDTLGHDLFLRIEYIE